jgi:hypothetical protein
MTHAEIGKQSDDVADRTVRIIAGIVRADLPPEQRNALIKIAVVGAMSAAVGIMSRHLVDELGGEVAARIPRPSPPPETT